MQYKTALIVGRFQPFHIGHLFLIKKALEKADKVIIGIGSSNIIDENNPIDFETRKKIIKAVAYKENFENRLIKIVPLNDFFNDKKWLTNLKKQVGKFDLALGNNEWTNNILEKAGYEVLRVDYYKRLLYEGWRIRKLIREENNLPASKRELTNWENRVPKYIVPWLTKFIIDYNKGLTSQFNHVVLGGTFDHFHKGHRILLEKAFKISKKVTIGIATEELYKNKFLPGLIESFEIRKKSVSEFLNKNNYLKRAKIISFSHFTGGADKIKDFEAIVVSKETSSNALKINSLREKNKLPLMTLVIIDDVLAADGKLISSERIRLGEIDRNGNSYELPAKKLELKMPESLRPTLQKPLGKVFKDKKTLLQYIETLKSTMVIAVGDIIVDSLIEYGINPDVKIIDFKSRRKEIAIRSELKKLKKFINNPGTINLKTAEKLKELIEYIVISSKHINRLAKSKIAKPEQNSDWFIVDGEEDLLALPVMLFAPLNSLVLYGHWQLGIIAVEINEEIKNMVYKIIGRFI